MGLQIGRSIFGKFKSVVMMTASFALVLGSVSFAAPQFFSQDAHAAPGDVSSQAEFESALAGTDANITLGADFTTDKQMTVTRNVTINGNGHVISPTFTKVDSSNNSVIGITGAGSVTISNLIIDGVNGVSLSGINAFKSGVTLNGVSLKNNDKYGAIVNGSNVTVNSISTSGNTYGGIDVDQSSTSNSALLTVNGVSTHAESGSDLFIDNAIKPVAIADNGNQYNVTNFGNARVYKLKPASPVVMPCTTTTTQSIHTTSLSNWDTSRTRANGHNEIVVGGLHVYTDGNSDTGVRTDGAQGNWNTDKAAGYFTTSFALKNMGDKTIAQSLDYENTPDNKAPGLQMVVDVNNDGTNDGILVGEDVYTNNWWLSEGTSTSQTGAPKVGGGGSAWNGTINQWLAAFPDAQVKAIGYSLGSGLKGDGVIKKISLGCTDYTFGVALQPPTDLTPTDNSFTNNPSFDNTWSAVAGAAKYQYETTYGSGDYYTDTSDASNYVLGVSTIIRHNNGSPQATYAWRVRAIDALGNMGPWSVYSHVTVDSVKPTMPVLSTPTDASSIPTNDFYFTWTDSTDSGTPVHYEFQSSQSNSQSNGVLNSGVWKNTTSSNPEQSYLATPKIHSVGANGTWYWQVRAIDAAGNESAWTAPRKVTIDLVAPTISWQLQPNTTYSQNQGFHVRPITNEVGTVKSVYIDSESPANLVWTLDSDHKNFDTSNTNNQPLWDSLADGQHKFIAVFSDYAGHVTKSSSNSFLIDRTGPTVTVKPESVGSIADGIFSNVSFKLFDTYKIDKVTLNGVTKDLGDNQWSDLNGVKPGVFGAVEGNNTLVVYDVAGNQTTLSFTLDTIAPEVTVGPTYNTTGNKIQPNVTVTGDPVSFVWTTTVPTTDVDISEASAKAPTFTVKKDGTYEFTLTVADAAGNQTAKVFSFTYTTPTATTINTETIPTVPEAPAFSSATVATTTGNGGTTTQRGTTSALQASEQAAPTEDVLGAQTKKNGEVLGTETAAVVASTTQGWKIFGVLWYWWALILALVGGIWWFIAARNRRQAQDV